MKVQDLLPKANEELMYEKKHKAVNQLKDYIERMNQADSPVEFEELKESFDEFLEQDVEDIPVEL